MTQKKPQFLASYTATKVLPAFGLAPEDLLPNMPIQTVSTGTPQLMIALRDHAALQCIQLNIPAYARLRAASDFFSPHLFCLGGATPGGQSFARPLGCRPTRWKTRSPDRPLAAWRRICGI